MKFCASFPALLQFSLETAEDVVEREPALAWRARAAAHSAHPDEPLRLHGSSPLRPGHAVALPCAVRARKAKGTWLASQPWPLAAQGAVCGGILLGLYASRSLGILLREDTDDARGDFVVNDGRVVFTDNVDTKFLVAVWVWSWQTTRERDIPRCRPSSAQTVATRDLLDLVAPR